MVYRARTASAEADMAVLCGRMPTTARLGRGFSTDGAAGLPPVPPAVTTYTTDPTAVTDAADAYELHLFFQTSTPLFTPGIDGGAPAPADYFAAAAQDVAFAKPEPAIVPAPVPVRHGAAPVRQAPKKAARAAPRLTAADRAYRQRREKNNAASRASRQKRRDLEATILEENDRLRTENAALRARLASLEGAL
jgi:hypothetical protein